MRPVLLKEDRITAAEIARRWSHDNNSAFIESVAMAIARARADERASCVAIVEETAAYYNTNFFREITSSDTDLIHQQHPGLIDRISASMSRLCCRNIVRAINDRVAK